MKFFISIIIFVCSILTATAQSASFKIIEIKGLVDIKDRTGEWRTVVAGDFLLDGTQIYTGLHSHISLEIGSDSYISVNQLSNVILDSMRIQKEEISSEVQLINGFVIVNTKVSEGYKTRLTISFPEGRATFEKAGGDIYLRKEYGTVITAGSGVVKIISQMTNRYNIRKNEKCAILPSGQLIRNEQFLMQNINSPVTGTKSTREKDLYLLRFHHNYSENSLKSDYGSQR